MLEAEDAGVKRTTERLMQTKTGTPTDSEQGYGKQSDKQKTSTQAWQWDSQKLGAIVMWPTKSDYPPKTF